MRSLGCSRSPRPSPLRTRCCDPLLRPRSPARQGAASVLAGVVGVGVVTVVRFKAPFRPLPIPESACRSIGVLRGGRELVQVGAVTFSLRRRKRGTEVSFCMPIDGGAFTWSASLLHDKWFKNFAEARQWAKAHLAQHGQEAVETTKRQRPRARGDDAKLLRSGGCSERWLSSDVPTLWAEAMMRCRHPAGYCGSDGYCHNGDCDMRMDATAGDSA